MAALVVAPLQELTLTLQSLLHGIRDSICGIGKIFELCRQSRELDDKPTRKEGTETPSVLAARRERQRNAEGQSTTVKKPESLEQLLFRCWFLNTIALGLVYFVVQAVMSYSDMVFVDKPVWRYCRIFFASLINILWVLPIVLLARFINTFTFIDISERIFKLLKQRGKNLPIVSVVTDMMFSLLTQLVFTLQGFVAASMPSPFGLILGIAHNSLLNSLYLFEYKWYAQGINVEQRLLRIERKWSYFIGFGLPLAVMYYALSAQLSLIVAMALYSTFFPFFLISAHLADTGVIRKDRDIPFFAFSFYMANKFSILVGLLRGVLGSIGWIQRIAQRLWRTNRR